MNFFLQKKIIYKIVSAIQWWHVQNLWKNLIEELHFTFFVIFIALLTVTVTAQLFDIL